MKYLKHSETGTEEITPAQALKPFLEYMEDGEQVVMDLWDAFHTFGAMSFKWFHLTIEPEFDEVQKGVMLACVESRRKQFQEKLIRPVSGTKDVEIQDVLHVMTAIINKLRPN